MFCPEFTTDVDYSRIIRMFINPKNSLSSRLIIGNSLKYKSQLSSMSGNGYISCLKIFSDVLKDLDVSA